MLPLLLMNVSAGYGFASNESSPQQVKKVGEKLTDPKSDLESILERPLYQQWQLRDRPEEEIVDENPWFRESLKALGEMIRDSLKTIFDTLGDLFARDDDTPPIDFGWDRITVVGLLKVLAWIFLEGAILILLLLLFRSALWRGRLAKPKVLSRHEIRHALALGDALAQDSDAWFEEAKRLSRNEDFRGLYRALYLALLSGLHMAEKIDYRPNRTNWTYVNRFRGDENEVKLFARLTSLFDDVWYGRIDPGNRSIDDLKGEVTTLLRKGGS
jgi:hypothetical protein